MSEATISLYKPSTRIRRTLEDISRRAEMLIVLDDILGDEEVSCYDTSDYEGEVSRPRMVLMPGNADAARKMVGRLIRAFGFKPRIKKESDTDLKARFEFAGFVVEVHDYRTANCRLVEQEVELPAEEERVVVTPARPARTEKKMVLVCDEGEVQEPREQPAEEVPF